MIPTLVTAVTSLGPWVHARVFGPGEVHATEVITRVELSTRADASANHLVQLGAALALWAPLHGHVCVDLGRVAAMVRAELAGASDAAETTDPDAQDAIENDAKDSDSSDNNNNNNNKSNNNNNNSNSKSAPNTQRALPLDTLVWPHIDQWLQALRSSSIVRVVHATDAQPVLDDRALVLSGQLLYTQRQWVDECVVATALRSRAASSACTVLSPNASALFEHLLPTHEGNHPNLQHTAAITALSAQIGVIVGGPGTGKTHTVARLLAVLLTDAADKGLALRVALAAPTGKAAARLREAITAAAHATDAVTGDRVLPGDIADQLTQLPATTLHRLLGPQGLVSTRFVHGTENPLPHDVIVADETSMVALPLMARLLEAVRPEARLILVGDPDQLESVDVGAVLADIVDASESVTSPLHHRLERLNRPQRQKTGSPIGPLSDAIRQNQAHDVVAQLRAGASDPDTGEPLLTFIEHANILRSPDVVDIRNVVLGPWDSARRAALDGRSADALHDLTSTRVLCAHRLGPHGAETWNRTIETWLLGVVPQARFYPGRALLVTRNDPGTRLSNGDTGIVVAHPDGVRAAFRLPDGVREFAPAQLESVETAFAMTIHKSQGSEYATVVVVLPPSTSPLIGRELLYTAVTRTTRQLIVVGTEAAVIAAVQTPARRVTGLTAALGGNIE